MRIGNQAGFTYLGLMLFIAVAGIALAATGLVWHQEVQREKERELLFIGQQYQQAIRSYYETTPAGIKQFPKKLEDLLKDSRFPQTRRHLRKLYQNPLNPESGWVLVKEQERIIGVYADSDKKPLRQVFREESMKSFSGASSYKEWRFIYNPGQKVDESAPVNEAPRPIPTVPVGRPDNLATPKPPIKPDENPCEKAAQVDYSACRATCLREKFDVCKQCYQSLRERLYACMQKQPLPALITKGSN